MAIQDEKLSIASLTGGDRQGEGAFDELMRTVKSHLSTEYEAGRITGDNYTQAYISALDMTLGNASQYLLAYEITNQQIRLLDEQIANAGKQTELTQEQINLIIAQTAHTEKQTVKLDSDIELVDAQVLIQTKQLLVMDEQITNLQKDIESKDSGILLQEKQGLLVDQQKLNAVTQELNIQKQTLKLTSEIAVLDQRVVSEQAQTSDTVGGSPVGGTIGKQNTLYERQADGYLRDAEQKAAKIMNDTFLTRISTEYDGADASAAGQSDSAVASVISKLVAGI